MDSKLWSSPSVTTGGLSREGRGLQTEIRDIESTHPAKDRVKPCPVTLRTRGRGKRGKCLYKKAIISGGWYITIYYPLSNVSIILLLSFTADILNLTLHSELMASLLIPSIRTFNSKFYVLYPCFLSQMTSTNHTQEIWTHECQFTNCTKQEKRKRGISYLWLW